ncbi:MAG: hypothetical protein HKM07_01290, partial [Chlamydiae bacterium]|nr:hypothetical protein [Chlamydiota bacterium]
KDTVQPEKPNETQEDATKAKKPNKRAAKNLTQIENAKFNLTPLLTDRESKAGKRRYKTAARLIKNLYGDAPFFDRRPEEKFEEFILDKMLEQGDLNVKNKKNITNENATLFDIFPAEEKYHRLFYKIFQGTKRYTLEKNEKSGKKLGYPPLHHFFTYKPQETKIIINFQDTSKAVLDAHFGEEICKKILEEEESVWKSEKRLLQMGDLQKLLQNADHGVTVDERLDGLELKKATKQKKKFLSSQDDKTGIVIERINNIPE